jgi:hypothetical protein
MNATKTVAVVLCHRTMISEARWCEPLGWRPANEILGAEYADGAWWADGDEEAGLICFVQGKEGQELQVGLDDLRVALCRDCQVIGPVLIDEDESEGLDAL